MVKEYERRRDYIVKTIEEIPGLSSADPKGAFYLFINCREICAKSGMNSQQLAEHLLDKYGIALVAGTVFGDSGEGYMRMSFANSYENIVEGCRRLREAAVELMK